MSVMNGNLCLVTGGAGFIGSHLVNLLLSLGAKVRVLDDFHSGTMENLTDCADNPNLQIISGSVCDQNVACEYTAGCDYVYHLACRNVRESLLHPTPNHDVNATGTFEMLKASARSGVKRFLYCSSSEVNGTAGIVPMPEDYHFKPETIYGASKLCGEYYTQVFHRSGWLDTVIARPHNNYGPREHYQGTKGEVIPRFILLALAGRPLTVYGNGLQTRDFTYVGETVDYLVKLSLEPTASGNTYNVCRGQEVSIIEIAKTIIKLTKSTSEIINLPARPNDVLRLYGDPGRLVRDLKNSPSVSIQEGLQNTIDWFRSHISISTELLETFSPREWENLEPESWLAEAKIQHTGRR